MKLGRMNDGPDHLSKIETGEEHTNIEDGLPDAQLFRVEMADGHYAPIIQFLLTGVALEELSTSQKKQLVVKAYDFQLIAGHLYKMGPDEILRRCVLPNEQEHIMEEAHVGIARGHYGGRDTT